jgi:hypothetical protein
MQRGAASKAALVTSPCSIWQSIASNPKGSASVYLRHLLDPLFKGDAEMFQRRRVAELL